MPLLFVARIQQGLSPVKKTPESDVSGLGDVTKGMNMCEMRLCSAMTLFSISSGRCMSKACAATFTNLMFRLHDLVAEGLESPVDGSASYIAIWPERRRTWMQESVQSKLN
jgi:hypothetical protein